MADQRGQRYCPLCICPILDYVNFLKFILNLIHSLTVILHTYVIILNSPTVCAVLALDSWNYCSGEQARQPNIHKIA